MPKVCDRCGQAIPQPDSRLICSACNLPIRRNQGGWKHGGDGRPRHNDCTAAAQPKPEIMQLLEAQ